MIEALSVGTPVIATAVGALPEIIQPGKNGLLVSPGDEEALGAAIASLADDAELLATLRRGAAKEVDSFAPERAFTAVEDQLRLAVESL